jgi:hypothetical protein
MKILLYNVRRKSRREPSPQGGLVRLSASLVGVRRSLNRRIEGDCKNSEGPAELGQ